MRPAQEDAPSAVDIQPLSPEPQGILHNNGGIDDPAVESVSAATTDNRKVSREDIELVQNLIERCLQLYMNRDEVVRTLSSRARIEPGFTTLVWQKLEEENSEFFRAYYIRLKLKKHIILFNHLLEYQYHLMRYPVQPKVPPTFIQNGLHHIPVNNLPMGYPVIQQPLVQSAGQTHHDSMVLSNCHLVSGIPAAGSFQPIGMNSGNDTPVESSTPEAAPCSAPYTAMPAMSDMAVSPASAASSNHFPFMPTEISGMSMDAAALDPTFPTDVATNGGLQLGPDNGVGSSEDSVRSFGPLWNFSFSDLTVELTNLGDLGPLENYSGSPFLHSDSDILLGSPEQDDNIVEEYFADTINNGHCSQSDEEKSQ